MHIRFYWSEYQFIKLNRLLVHWFFYSYYLGFLSCFCNTVDGINTIGLITNWMSCEAFAEKHTSLPFLLQFSSCFFRVDILFFLDFFLAIISLKYTLIVFGSNEMYFCLDLHQLFPKRTRHHYPRLLLLRAAVSISQCIHAIHFIDTFSSLEAFLNFGKYYHISSLCNYCTTTPFCWEWYRHVWQQGWPGRYRSILLYFI